MRPLHHMSSLLAKVIVLSLLFWISPVLAQAADTSLEKQAFEAAKELGTVEAWDAFLSNYPKGFHADLARAYVKKLAGDGAGGGSSPEPAGAPPPSAGVPLQPAADAVSVVPAAIRVGKWPERLASDSQWLWVSESGQKSIAQIDRGAGQVVERLSVQRLPVSMAGTGDGRIFVLNNTDNSIWVREYGGSRAKPFASLPSCAQAMAFDGTSLWAVSLPNCGGQGSVLSKVAADSGIVTRIASMADGAEDIEAAGGYVTVSHGNSTPFLSVVNMASGVVTKTENPGIHLARLASNAEAVFAAGGPAGQETGLVRKLATGSQKFSASRQLSERITAIAATDQYVVAVGVRTAIFILSARDLSILRTISAGRPLDAKDVLVDGGRLFIAASSGGSSLSDNAVYVIDGWMPGSPVSAPQFAARSEAPAAPREPPKVRTPPLKCAQNYALRNGECVLLQNCGANAYRSPEGDCYCNKNYEMRQGKCVWKTDKKGFEIKPWEKQGCKTWQKRCGQGDNGACAKFESNCQVN